jgi:hypothetical protein
MVGWRDGLEADCLLGGRRAIGGFRFHPTLDVLEVAVERGGIVGCGLLGGLFGRFGSLEMGVAGVGAAGEGVDGCGVALFHLGLGWVLVAALLFGIAVPRWEIFLQF